MVFGAEWIELPPEIEEDLERWAVEWGRKERARTLWQRALYYIGHPFRVLYGRLYRFLRFRLGRATAAPAVQEEAQEEQELPLDPDERLAELELRFRQTRRGQLILQDPVTGDPYTEHDMRRRRRRGW